MPIEHAFEFFESVPAIARYLKTLCDVGLGYVRLGQSAPTLSGGEAQRVKLATELQRRSTGRTIYVLDEPTTGLHFEDVSKLLGVLNRLADGGNTVVVIEHNLDVIKSADWVIDLGPDGGARGGTIVAEGTPETVAKNKKSYTGAFLAEVLNGGRKSWLIQRVIARKTFPPLLACIGSLTKTARLSMLGRLRIFDRDSVHISRAILMRKYDGWSGKPTELNGRLSETKLNPSNWNSLGFSRSDLSTTSFSETINPSRIWH